MTYDDISRKIMSGEKIFNLPLRVCYYARVSTDSDVQLNSLDNQLDYYEKYIKSKPNWTYVGGYVEEGVTGVRVDKRESFKKMIKDAKEQKFNLIITKEVSRFARDLEDSIHYIRILKNANVGVFFENQNLNTFDFNSELILNIMFNLAQDESRKLSSRVKFGHKEAIAKGHVLGSSNITGYKKDHCKLVIVEEEAKFIKKLYELYATGEYGFLKLSKKLSSLGYKNKKGNFYDKDSLKRMLENPKYKGYYRAKVHEIIDYRTKKRKTNKLEDQVIHKCLDGSIPSIVSEELWDKANKILKARTSSYKRNNFWSGGLKYSFSSKIYCHDCNTKYQRSHGSKNKNRPIWSCASYLQFRLVACASPLIEELDLYNILTSIMSCLIPKNSSVINNLLKLYGENTNNEYMSELKDIDNKIKKMEEKKDLLLDLVLNNELDRESLKKQFKKIEDEINKNTLKRDKILTQIKLFKNHNNLNKLINLIEMELNEGMIDAFIRKFVDEIIVTKINNERNNIKLDIYLNLYGTEKAKTKGARHINGPINGDLLYLKDQEYFPLKNACLLNKITYDVHLESL